MFIYYILLERETDWAHTDDIWSAGYQTRVLTYVSPVLYLLNHLSNHPKRFYLEREDFVGIFGF